MATLYLDAVPVLSSDVLFPLTRIEDYNNWLGRSNWGHPFFTGELDEFRIYTGVLTPEQVSQSFADGPEPALAASPFKVVSFARLAAGGYALAIDSKLPADRHVVQASSNLVDWSDVNGLTWTTTGANLTTEIPGSVDSRKFYRVKIP